MVPGPREKSVRSGSDPAWSSTLKAGLSCSLVRQIDGLRITELVATVAVLILVRHAKTGLSVQPLLPVRVAVSAVSCTEHASCAKALSMVKKSQAAISLVSSDEDSDSRPQKRVSKITKQTKTAKVGSGQNKPCAAY